MSDCNDELASCASLCTTDGRQTATLLSVSVTFKSQENLEKDGSSESKIPGQSQGHGSDAAVDEEESLCWREIKAESTPPTTISEAKVKTTKASMKSKVLKTEILPGWKGYSNSIYIQPIIVNSRRNQETKNCLKSGKFTVEDLRQQLRLRQSSEWVVKHNQRIHLKGSLKSGVPNPNPEMNTCISRCHSSLTATGNPELDLSKHSHSVRQTNKQLAKGFVCRNWEREFLSKESEIQQEGEPSSLTIRSYVNVNMMGALSKTIRNPEHKKRECHADTPGRQPENTSSPNCDAEEGHQVSRRSSLSSSLVSSEFTSRDNLHQDINDLIFGKISVNMPNPCSDDTCAIGSNEIAATSHGTEMCPSKSGKEKGTARSLLKRRQEQKMFISVPLKEFPPIDPLRDLRMSSSKFQTMGKRKLPRRPHTVGTSCSFGNINEKKKAEGPRISSSKSLDSHFRGIHGKAVKHPLKIWHIRGNSSKY